MYNNDNDEKICINYNSDIESQSSLSSIIIKKYYYLKILKYILFILCIFFIIFIILYNCLYFDYYYYVNTNSSLPFGINMNNIQCSFKYYNKYYNCYLQYNNNTNITNIIFKNHHFNNFNNLFGDLYLEFNNDIYNKLLFGFKNNQIFYKSFRRCDLNSPEL